MFLTADQLAVLERTTNDVIARWMMEAFLQNNRRWIDGVMASQ